MNSVSTSSNKRIARNTMMLYIRMFVIMGVTLYMSRVVLDALGVDDYGIYNIVGGIVVLFAFINGAMTTAVQRFLNYDLGRNDTGEAQRDFAASLNIYLGISVLFIILAETVGLWFLDTYINIPPTRADAAWWAYQLTVLTTVLNMLRTVYNAAIIAHERMSFYAYTSIIEAALRLGVAFAIFMFPDRLISYAALLAAVSLIILAWYMVYCRAKFEICRHHTFTYEKARYRGLIGFSGWSMLGAMANTGAQQGCNVLMNIFFGVASNAALGIANQVNSAIYNFLSNFQTAFNPQIVKTYAAGEKENFTNLLINASKYSYFLMLMIIIPLYICCDEVLGLWLTEVPQHSASFCKLMFMFTMVDALQGPLWVSVQATGKIRNYQILMSILILSSVPVSYVLLKFIKVAEVILAARVLANVVTAVARVIYLRKLLDFPIARYLKEVIAISLIVTAIAVVAPCVTYECLTGWAKVAVTVIVAILSTALTVFFIGMKRNERNFVLKTLKQFAHRP